MLSVKLIAPHLVQPLVPHWAYLWYTCCNLLVLTDQTFCSTCGLTFLFNIRLVVAHWVRLHIAHRIQRFQQESCIKVIVCSKIHPSSLPSFLSRSIRVSGYIWVDKYFLIIEKSFTLSTCSQKSFQQLTLPFEFCHCICWAFYNSHPSIWNVFCEVPK